MVCADADVPLTQVLYGDKEDKTMTTESSTNEFSDEEGLSNYGYFSGHKSKPVEEQLKVLQSLFNGLESLDEVALKGVLPSNAEGTFLMPRWEKLASTYGKAVEIVLAKFFDARKGNFYNPREGEIDSRQLEQSTKKMDCFQKLGDQQKGHDILVVAAQFGLRHRGRSARRARVMMDGNEFGLGAFEVGIMLLTHPERLMHKNDLFIQCVGDEYGSRKYTPLDRGAYSYAPSFFFYANKLYFGEAMVKDRSESHGAASGFCLQ